MPTIGDFAVDSFPPQLFDAVGEYRLIRRPGVDGSAILVNAWYADPVIGRFMSTLTVGADPWPVIDRIRAMQFKSVTVFDGLNYSWQCTVLRVVGAPNVDVLGRTVIKSDWILQPESSRP
jgi:hypothetical protein